MLGPQEALLAHEKVEAVRVVQGDEPYQHFIEVGFVDGWMRSFKTDPGETLLMSFTSIRLWLERAVASGEYARRREEALKSSDLTAALRRMPVDNLRGDPPAALALLVTLKERDGMGITRPGVSSRFMVPVQPIVPGEGLCGVGFAAALASPAALAEVSAGGPEEDWWQNVLRTRLYPCSGLPRVKAPETGDFVEVCLMGVDGSTAWHPALVTDGDLNPTCMISAAGVAVKFDPDNLEEVEPGVVKGWSLHHEDSAAAPADRVGCWRWAR